MCSGAAAPRIGLPGLLSAPSWLHIPMQTSQKGQRLAALFLLGCLLFNYPLLQLFTRDVTLFGLPLLYCYVFGAWGALIGLMLLVAEHKENSD
mgnify:CR=1 FL=1